MATFFGILLIIFIAIPLLWQFISPLFQRWLMGKMEDRFRHMAGMPSRKEEKRARRRRSPGSGSASSRQTRNAHPKSHEPIIPKEYAEDVEFVEYVSYSETTVEEHVEPDGSKTRVVTESQIEDAEFVEIKGDGEK